MKNARAQVLLQSDESSIARRVSDVTAYLVMSSQESAVRNLRLSSPFHIPISQHLIRHHIAPVCSRSSIDRGGRPFASEIVSHFRVQLFSSLRLGPISTRTFLLRATRFSCVLGCWFWTVLFGYRYLLTILCSGFWLAACVISIIQHAEITNASYLIRSARPLLSG